MRQRTDWIGVVTLATATLVVAGEISMSAFALPLISVQLDVATDTTAWVLLSYSIPIAALSISAGRVVDRADIRLTFALSLCAACIASVLTVIAPSFGWLIATRVLQGFGAAAYLAVYFPVVVASVREDQRGRAMSYIATIMMFGSVALAPLGGFVAETFGWRAVFLIKIPLLLPLIWIGLRTIPRGDAATASEPEMPLRVKELVIETLLLGGFVAGVLLALDALSERSQVGFGYIAGAAFLVAVWSRSQAGRPIVTLLRDRSFGLPTLSLVLMSSLIGLIAFSLPFFVSDVAQRGPRELSFLMMCFIGAVSMVSPAAGFAADRWGALKVARGGAVVAFIGMISVALLDASTSLVGVAWRTALVGVGMAFFNSPNLTAILRATPTGKAGVAGGITNLGRTLGNTLGPALAASAWPLAGGGIDGFRVGALVLGVLTLAAVVATFCVGEPRA